MAAKKIRISDDGGSNYYTLPGSTGEMRREVATFNDTVFGQSWASEDVSLGQWNVTANARYKGLAGYLATLKQGGTPTAMTAEACTLLSGKTYQITASAKRMISLTASLVILDNAVDKTAFVQSVDYLNGTVTFLSSYTVTGPVTITGSYIPLTTLAKFKNFDLSQTSAEIDTSVYEDAQANGGWRTFIPGLQGASIDLSGIYDSSNGFEAALAARSLLYLDVSPPGDGSAFFRGFFKRKELGQSGEVGALEQSSLKLGLYVPDGSLVERPFGWYFTTGATLNTAVKKAIAAWQTNTPIKIQYLPDGVTGTNGWGGDAIITDISMSNAIDGQNEFKCSFRGTGAPIST